MDHIYTDAIWAEPTLTTAQRLLASGQEFYCYRFDRVSPDRKAANVLAKHTAELRYLFGALRADGYDDTDKRVAAWMQAQWIGFARDGAPADDAIWRPYGEDQHIVVIGDDVQQARIDDDPVVPLLHTLRATKSSSHRRWFSFFGRQ